MPAECPRCHQALPSAEGEAVRFCPFCGQSLTAAPVESGPSPLQLKLEKEKNPKKKHKLIQEALAANPDDFDANCALLYHGNLHEALQRKRGGGISFSNIKCHLVGVFHEPDVYTAQELDAMYEELLRGPQLRKTLALAPDPDAFFAAYLNRMAYEYVSLFIRGDSRYANLPFGLPRSADSTARTCAVPVKKMLDEVADSNRLTAAERAILLGAIRDAFAQVFGASARYLDS